MSFGSSLVVSNVSFGLGGVSLVASDVSFGLGVVSLVLESTRGHRDAANSLGAVICSTRVSERRTSTSSFSIVIVLVEDTISIDTIIFGTLGLLGIKLDNLTCVIRCIASNVCFGLGVVSLVDSNVSFGLGVGYA